MAASARSCRPPKAHGRETAETGLLAENASQLAGFVIVAAQGVMIRREGKAFPESRLPALPGRDIARALP
ncbi:hypothetical protein [Paracoccus stylophorae]|uniref:hypothetical protein n=1 Tax=Paracoccus stylophorae TaxID=659350 RepID=UPI00235083B1|nr:hypothetical protein [Paracoccus stylophorae]